MKINVVLCSFFIFGIIGISACNHEDKELKKDAKVIADVMCKTMEAMKNLKTIDPADTAQVEKLQMEYAAVQEEMTVLYGKFNTKYGEKTKSKEFNAEFRKCLSAAMLDCKSLSKEDREIFEKEVK